MRLNPLEVRLKQRWKMNIPARGLQGDWSRGQIGLGQKGMESISGVGRIRSDGSSYQIRRLGLGGSGRLMGGGGLMEWEWVPDWVANGWVRQK